MKIIYWFHCLMVIRHRKLNRLKNFDYSSSGYYFVTICTKNRRVYFGNINNNKIILNLYGNIVQKYIFELPKRYKNIGLDQFIIMPNHIHLIIIIKYTPIPVGTIHELSLQNTNNQLQRRNMLLCKIIGFLKMNSSKQIHQMGLNLFQWQRSYYDEIIRNEYSLYFIRQYIRENPINWSEDRNNLFTKK